MPDSKTKQELVQSKSMDAGRGILQGDSILPFYDVWHLSHPSTS